MTWGRAITRSGYKPPWLAPVRFPGGSDTAPSPTPCCTSPSGSRARLTGTSPGPTVIPASLARGTPGGALSRCCRSRPQPRRHGPFLPCLPRPGLRGGAGPGQCFPG